MPLTLRVSGGQRRQLHAVVMSGSFVATQALMACHHVCRPEGPSRNLFNRLRVNPFLHHLQGEPDIADLAVILGVVLPAEHPIGD